MFVIVNVKQTGKRRIKKGRTVEKVYEHFNTGGERYYIADVLAGEKGVDWDEVSRFLGRHSSRILLDKNVILPENSKVSRFEPVLFKNLLIFNTLELILKQMYLAGCRTNCYINDPKGEYFSFLPAIARYSARTTVITSNRFRYVYQAAKLYSDFGAGVSVTENADVLSDDAIVIDTAGTFFGKKGIVFSPFNNGITPKYTDGFNEFKVLCPAYIETVDFLGAVFELNQNRKLESALCRMFTLDGYDIKTVELLEQLMPANKKTDSQTSIIFTV